MKKLIYIYFIIFCSGLNNILFGQDSLFLHLVMFTSRDVDSEFWDVRNEKEMDRTLPSILWRLEGDSLVLLDTLNFYSESDTDFELSEMYLCRQFTERKWIYMMEREFFPIYYYPKATETDSFLDEDTFLSTLDYSGDDIIIRRLRCSEYTPFKSYSLYSMSYFENNKIMYEYSFDKNSNHYGDFIISKYLNDGHEMRKNTFIDSFYVKDESGMFYREHQLFLIRKDNQIKNTIYERNKYETLEDWPENDMNIPASDDEYKYYSRFEFLLYTPQNRYIIGKKQRHKPNPDSLELYYVFDKETQIWDTIYMPNDVRNFNVYKDRYLYGTIWGRKSYCKGYKSSKDCVLAFIKKYPKKYSWKYSNYPNLANCSGKFFIYDLEKRKYVEMKAEDRDAELIEIIDGWIYYRVYDEIRRMKLGLEPNYFDKSTVEVLVKNKEVIPNVHHIFLKGKCPVVEEWITPDPHKKRKAFKVKIGK